MEWREGRAGQARRSGEAAHPCPALPTHFLTRWIWKHLIGGELALERPHSKGLRYLRREKGGGYQGTVWGGSAPGLDPPQLGATYRVGPFFPGRSLRRLGIRLVHSRLGKGISKCQKQQSGRREGASDTFPLVSSSGHPGLPFPLLWAPGNWQVTRRDQEGDPCRRRGGGSRSGRRLSHPLKLAVTYLGDPTGIGSLGRAGPGLPQERTGPRAVGSRCSVLAQCPGFLSPSPLSHTHLTPRSLSSCRPVLRAILAARISEPLRSPVP